MTKELILISIGPGDNQYTLPLAMQKLSMVTDVVAYQLYLDLVENVTKDKVCHTSALGSEIQRAQRALDLAASGKATALISSGDIGIYAMAAVVFELLDKDPQPGWSDVDIVLIPGISAMQTLAARVGAPLGHDFCAISLSDLLTPWEVIKKRIEGAGHGDFVVSFYNPISKKRTWQLNAARDILLEYRPATTPVIIGRNLARTDESVIITTLEKLATHTVDMLSIVMVGSSTSVTFEHHQEMKVYTPRGYEKKLG